MYMARCLYVIVIIQLLWNKNLFMIDWLIDWFEVVERYYILLPYRGGLFYWWRKPGGTTDTRWVTDQLFFIPVLNGYTKSNDSLFNETPATVIFVVLFKNILKAYYVYTIWVTSLITKIDGNENSKINRDE